MKPQILIVHGGTPFETYEEYIDYLKSKELKLEDLSFKDWKENLAKDLPEFEVVYPKMPNAKNARYLEWKIWFEKVLPFIRDGVILVGHSLGGIFLAKYLSENKFSVTIASLHLVAAPYDTEVCKDSLVDFALTGTVDKLAEVSGKIYLYQSKDDPAVPFADFEKYARDLPSATTRIFDGHGHFRQEEFPELVADIKAQLKSQNHE